MMMSSLEHSLAQTFRQLGVVNERLLLAVSGGMDSQFLLRILVKLQTLLKLELSVVHVHHGFNGDEDQIEYRDRAYDLVKSFCLENNISFYSNLDKDRGNINILESLSHFETMKSEADFREYREFVYDHFLTKLDISRVVLAHHQEDLIETRLLRMIRGVGPEGLEAMKEVSGKKIRPLLKYSRTELYGWMMDSGGQWIEDPSNKKTDYLRNWIRREWLPSLETRVPGGVKNFSRSLLRIEEGENFSQTQWERVVRHSESILRKPFAELDLPSKRGIVAKFFNEKNIYGYTENHINEFIKRLDTDRKRFTFILVKRSWSVLPESVCMTVQDPGTES